MENNQIEICSDESDVDKKNSSSSVSSESEEICFKNENDISKDLPISKKPRIESKTPNVTKLTSKNSDDSEELESKSSKNIFFENKASPKTVKTSSFLTTTVKKEEKNIIEEKNNSCIENNKELGNLLFKSKSTFYNFVDKKWEKIGPGFIYLYKNQEKRVFFVRDGILTVPFDFLITYDLKACKKENGVSFISPTKKPILILFDDLKKRDEFFDCMKSV